MTKTGATSANALEVSHVPFCLIAFRRNPHSVEVNSPSTADMADMAMGTRGNPDVGHGISALARQTIKILVASGLLAGIIVIIQFTVRAESISEQKGRLDGFLTADVSTTITIVRALQGILTTLVTVSLAQAFSYLQWSFIRSSGADGVPYARQLALSPTTSVSGTLSLIFHRSTPLESRLWALFRLFLMIVVGLAGIVLFCMSYSLHPTHPPLTACGLAADTLGYPLKSGHL